MPVFDALGRTYDVRVVDANGTVMTEYMDDTGRPDVDYRTAWRLVQGDLPLCRVI